MLQAARQQLTRDRWELKRHAHQLYTSQIALDEISAGEAEMARRRLELMARVTILQLTFGAEILAAKILQSGLLPANADSDAAHIALATVHRMDILLTWNCRHIANAEIVVRLRRLVHAQDYQLPVRFSTTPDWTAESDQANAYLGWSLAVLDADSDLVMDFAVGAPGYTDSLTDQGGVFIWHGSDTGLGSSGTPSNADWTAYGPDANIQFGYSIAGINSIQGDGYDSLAVGAPYFNSGTNWYTGKVYVFYGGSSGIDTTVDWTAQGANLYEHFGWSVAAAGDVNFDGD